MKKMKRFLALSLALALTVIFAACGGTTSSSAPASSTAASSTAPASSAPEATGLRIGIVTSSGVDDGSFGQNCYEGIMAFIEQHPEATVNHVKQPDIDKVVQAVADIIADYDVMVCPGFQFNTIGQIAIDNPDKLFILVDSYPVDGEGNEVELENVYAMQFKEQESGFFAGIAAALETQTNKVAVVNGIAYPSNVNYQYGFESGVNYANKHYGTTVEVLELASYAGTDVTGANVDGNYIGAFADQATGKVVGQALLEQGADILFVAAGDSGNGVFAAVKEAEGDNFVIGCDVDQYDLGETGSRNIVLTSGLKNMSINVTRQLEEMNNGTFKGVNALLDATTDSTGYVSQEGRQQLSAETLEKLQEVYDLIKDGTIVPAANFNGHASDDFPGL